MRIKLKTEQLEKLARGLQFEVIIDSPRDVRGMLDLLGRSMPWDDTGLSKFGDSAQKPTNNISSKPKRIHKNPPR